MSTNSRFYPNLYKDSVSLMTVSAQVTSIPGIEAASVVMASATNAGEMGSRNSVPQGIPRAVSLVSRPRATRRPVR